MESKFTKGPWGIKGNLILTNVGSDDPCRIITIATVGQTYHEDVCNANAKLIKSSPDLLEALQQGAELMEYLINATPTGKVRDTMCDFNIIARAAIAKALD